MISFILLCHYSISYACSCYSVSNYCDYLSPDDAIVVARVKDIASEEADILIEMVVSGRLAEGLYHFQGDQRTSCEASIAEMEAGEYYLLSFASRYLPGDTITYYQCMAPILKLVSYSPGQNHVLIKAVTKACQLPENTLDASVYPNPVQTSEITVAVEESSGEITFSLFSVDGKQRRSGRYIVSESDAVLRIPIPDLPSGIYTLHMTDGVLSRSDRIYVYR